MTNTDLLEELKDAFKPVLFGDAGVSERDARVERWFQQAVDETSSLTSPQSAINAYVRWKAWDKAYKELEANPEKIGVDAEGDVDMGDISKRLSRRAAERDRWEAKYNGLLEEPPVSVDTSPAKTVTIPVEFEF